MARHDVQLTGFAASLDECPKRPLPEFALSGRSNVGKSSLVNLLVGRKALAFTSKQPGKTRVFTYYEVDGRFMLVDMPGYGFARVPVHERQKWARAAKQYFHNREQLAGAIQLVDAKVGPTPDDRARLRELATLGHPICVVLTKCDKVSKSQHERVVREHLAPLGLPPETGVVLSSAVKGYGQREIWAWIEDQLATPAGPGPV